MIEFGSQSHCGFSVECLEALDRIYNPRGNPQIRPERAEQWVRSHFLALTYEENGLPTDLGWAVLDEINKEATSK